MLASSAAPTTTTQTAAATTASPIRPSRLRGLSYIRNYTTERLHSRADAPSLTRSVSTPNASTLPQSQLQAMNDTAAAAGTNNATTSTQQRNEQHPAIRFIPHIELRSSRPSLNFTTITKTLKNSRGVIRIGRYTEREQNSETDEFIPVGFKSKVVSRRHCEFWCTNGQWYVKDVKSSSGTFLNHVRLSSPGLESRPFPINDGDVVQLGIDFKGGEELIFRCVKIRIECNRGWQKALNSYNTATHKKLLNSVSAGKTKGDSDAASVGSHECSICLNPVTPCQCLFVAPCSHVWHYKCVRNLVHSANYPNFLCPNCRFVADLEADVEQPEDLYEEAETGKVEDAEQGARSSSSDEVVGRMDEDVPSQEMDIDGDNVAADTSEISGDPDAAITQPVPVTPRTAIKRENSPRHINLSPETPDGRLGMVVADQLLTPRNDAGPFILDGAATGSGTR